MGVRVFKLSMIGLLTALILVAGVRIAAQPADATPTGVAVTSAWTPVPITPRFTPVTIVPRVTVPVVASPVPTKSGPIPFTDTENLFPAGVRFSAVVTFGNKELVSGTLRIWQASSDYEQIQTIDMVKATQLINDNESLVTYVWSLTPQNMPEPFSKLRYEWAIKISGNRTIRASGDFVFEDSRRPEATAATWGRYEGAVSIYSPNPDLALTIVGTAVDKAYTRLLETLPNLNNYRFVVYDPNVQFCLTNPAPGEGEPAFYLESRTIGQTRIACDPTIALSLYSLRGYTMVVRTSLAIDQLEDQLMSAIIEDTLNRYWQGARTPSAWLREGLINLYGLAPRIWALPLARTALRGSTLLPYADMSEAPRDLTVQRLWQAQSYLLTVYLAYRFGADAPLQVMRAVGEGYSVETALSTFYQVSAETLFRDWQSWLLSDEAARATRWSPYSAATPLPTDTPTPRPSITPTSNIPTATRTPTLTLTFPYDLYKSPIGPTSSPSPLPAGSLNRPTIALTPTPTPPAKPSGLCGGSLMTLLLPAGAALLTATRKRAARG